MGEPSKKKKGCRSLTGPGFRNARDLTVKECKKLCVTSFDRVVESLLPDLGWTGDLYGCVGLNFANDNRSITNGHFFMVGQLFPGSDSKKFSASKFWANGADIDLQLSVPSASIFSFSDSLVSDLLDSSEIPHAFFSSGRRLEDEEVEAANIPGFSVRLFVNPSKETFAKLSVVLYPLPLDTLLETHVLGSNPQFPGLSVFSGEFPIGPPHTSVPRTPAPWGCPIDPVITAASFSEFPQVPSGKELRHKIAQVLRAGTKPEIKNGPAALKKRWDEIASAGPSKLLKKQHDVIWPLPPPAPVLEPDTNAASEDSEPSDREVGTEDHSDDARESTTDVESSGTEETMEEATNHTVDMADDTISLSNTPIQELHRRLQDELRKAGANKTKAKPKASAAKSSAVALGDKADKAKKRKKAKEAKTQKKKKRSKDSSSDSDSSNSSDEDDPLEDSQLWDPTSNMAKFEELWPVSDRPARFRKPEAFNKLEEASIYSMFNMMQEIIKKKKSNSFESINKVVKLKPIHYEAATDDGYYKELNPARFSMLPFGPPAKWWKDVPLNRDDTGVCIDLPLEDLDCQNLVAPKVLVWMHDRTLPKLMKHFVPENANVANRPRKKIERMENGEVTSLTDYWWTECTALITAQECILTYTAVLHVVWPCDGTGINMTRLLTRYKWVSASSDEGVRVAVVTMFFNTVIEENCKRAINKKPPYTYKEQEIVLKRVLGLNGLKTDLPLLGSVASATSGPSPSSQPSSLWAGKGKSGNQFTAVSKSTREPRKFAEINGQRTCYQFNSPRGNDCKNKRAAGGCVDASGKNTYAHVCNQYMKDKNAFCLLRHPRRDHR